MTDKNSLYYKILHAKGAKFTVARLFIFGPIGFGFGYLFWSLTLEATNVLEGDLKEILKWLVIVGFALGCAMVPILRCLSLITLVSLAFGEGQAIVQVSIMMAINDVLIRNLLDNYVAAEVSMKCNMVLAQNFSRTRNEIMNKPDQDMIYQMAMGAQESHKVVGAVEDVFEPLGNELVGAQETDELVQKHHEDFVKALMLNSGDPVMDNNQPSPEELLKKDEERKTAEEANLKKKFKNEISRQYSRKMMYRCDDIFMNAYFVCYNALDYHYQKCLNTSKTMAYLTILFGAAVTYMACSVIHPRRGCFFLELMSKSDAECNTGDNAIPIEMGKLEKELVDAAENSQNVMAEFEVNVQFEAHIPPRRLKVYSVEQAFSRIDSNFAWLQDLTSIIQTIFQALRIMLLAYSLFATYKWIKSYLKNVTHENVLITREFLSIDQRRALENRQHFGKFRKFESQRVNDSYFKPRLSKQERNRLLKGCVDLLYFGAFVLMYTKAATTFYDLLMSVYTYSRFDAQQVGYHQITMRVNGSGFLARLVKSVLTEFNRSVDVNQTLDNEHCRVQPQDLNWSASDGVGYIWILLSILFVQKLLFTYMTRIRLLVASFTFPERKLTRILWLYNNMLDVRFKKFFQAKDAMETWAYEPEKIPEESFIALLLKKKPKACFFVKWLVKKRCFICNDSTNAKNKKRSCEYHNIHFCDQCLNAYPCFKQCYACRVLHWCEHFHQPTTIKVPLGRAKFQAAGFLLCRETVTHTWQFLLLQSAKNPIHWSPPKGIVKPDEDALTAAVRITHEETGLHNCYGSFYVDDGDEYHRCDYEYALSTEDLVVFSKAQLGFKKVTYWVAILVKPNHPIKISSKHIGYNWFDVERACKFAEYQNSPAAFLKADYYLRKQLASY